MNRATRISKGEYNYRGYHIEEVGQYSDTGKPAWNITAHDEDSAHDTTNTLKDAKSLIDHWKVSR